MDSQTIIKRYDAVKQERTGNVEQLWDLIERFVLPFRGDFYATLNDEHEVDWHRRDIYSSTAVFACQSLAAAIHGNLTSPSSRWFELQFRDEELNSNDAAREWLEDVGKKIFDALQDSNFNIEIAEAYIDLVGFGTSVLTEETENELEWTGLNFQALSAREIYFEEDFKKGVEILYRRLQWSPLQIISKWGIENVPDRVKTKADKADASTQKIEVIFCVYPRKDKKDADTTKILAPLERPYGFKYILHSGGELLGDEGGYYEMPAYIARWRKVAGSRWGHSPASVALGDILTANQLIEATLEAAGKAIDPTIMANETAIIGDLDLDRGSLNIVNDINGVRPFDSGTRFDVSAIQLERLDDAIRKAFFQDQLELKESPAMTATEVRARQEILQRLLGPTLGRLQNDLLDPLIQRSFNIMYRAGELPEIPAGLELAEMDIEYTGILPRSQKAEVAAAIDNWQFSIGQRAEMFPELLDLVDVDRAERYKARLLGVPALAIRSQEEVDGIRKQRQEAQAKAEQAQQAQQQGEAAQAMGQGAQAMGAGAEAMGQDPQQMLQAVQ